MNRVAVLDPGAVPQPVGTTAIRTVDVIQDSTLGPVWDVQAYAGEIYAGTKNGVRRFRVSSDGQIAAHGVLVAGNFVRALQVVDGKILIGDRTGITVANLAGTKLTSKVIVGGVTDLQTIDFDGDGRFDWQNDRVYAVGAGPVTAWRFNPQTNTLTSVPMITINPSGSFQPTILADHWAFHEGQGSVAGLVLPLLRAQNTRLYTSAGTVMSWDQHATNKTNEPNGTTQPIVEDSVAKQNSVFSPRAGKLWRRR